MFEKEQEPPSSAGHAENSTMSTDGDSGFEVIEDDGPASPGSIIEGAPDSDDPDTSKDRSAGVSVSNENNILLDPEVLSDFTTQALVLTVLATLVKYTTDESETRILYQYLAEGSVVFPKVFPVIHSLLDMKINHVLTLCHDQVILSAVQSIIQNMISSEDASQQQLHYMQSCGFGGLWRFAGPFTKCNCTAESSELFVNCLEAMVETCLPVEDGETGETVRPSAALGTHLSGSLGSLALPSPTDREYSTEECYASPSSVHRLSGTMNK